MDELKKLLLNVVPSLCILMLMAELRVLLLRSCTNQSGQYPRQIVDLAQFEEVCPLPPSLVRCSKLQVIRCIFHFPTP